MITFSQIGKFGRFGNQMFQYASLCGIAKTAKYRYGIPRTNKSSDDYQHFCLDEAFDNLEAENSEGHHIHYRISEPKFGYNPGLLGIPDHSDLIGYFQTEKYFVNYRTNILKQFTFKSEIQEKAIDIRSLTREPVISLHIRLGDYTTLQDKHPVCKKQYYDEALSMLPDDLCIFVFSDDPKQAENIFSSLKRKMVFPETNDKYIDMCLMSLCDYHIIANSSFSWWGSWLSNTKKTIAPSEWFGTSLDMPKDWRDIYCKDWIII